MTTTDDTWLDAFDVLLTTCAAGGPLLELGCGEGRDTRHLTGRGAEVVAVDRRVDALRACRTRAPKARLVGLDLAEPLPFADGRFALVLASLSLHYFDAIATRAILREIGRVSRQDGALVLRVNSTLDEHFGATDHPELEPGLRLVEGRAKRFFDRTALIELVTPDWTLLSLEARTIDRYEKPKRVWEAVLCTKGGPPRSIDIGRATREDCMGIARVHVLSWQFGYREQLSEAYLRSQSVERRASWWTRAVLAGDPLVSVARDGERVVGFVAFGASRDHDAGTVTAEIHAIYVSPLDWRRGVGGALLTAALERLRTDGYEHVTLWVIEDNRRALGFYRRRGFERNDASAKTFELGATTLRERRLRLTL